MTNQIDGILLFNKPAGITSSHCIQKIKRTLQIQKIGHAGTLDKFATGLLVVLLGKATKLSDIFLNLDKTYETEFFFGKETNTLDVNGICIKECAIPSETQVLESINKFKGSISQIPPQYSALHVQGKRASDLARDDKVFELAPRDVTIYANEVLEMNLPSIYMRWHVSKGTYIRALARDLGMECNSCAYVTKLMRTTIGDFSLIDAATIDDINNSSEKIKGFFSITSVMNYINDCQSVDIDDDSIRVKLSNGNQPLDLLQSIPVNKKYLTILFKSQIIGIWRNQDDRWKLMLAC